MIFDILAANHDVRLFKRAICESNALNIRSAYIKFECWVHSHFLLGDTYSSTKIMKIKINSPDGKHEGSLIIAGDIRFGQPYYYLKWG